MSTAPARYEDTFIESAAGRVRPRVRPYASGLTEAEVSVVGEA